MRVEEQFDSFYLKTRRALVHQAFALTGDLPAAQKAVRDTYVAAWHHWRKVSAYDDPRDWVRPRAYLLAQNKHTARLWHRTKGTSPEDKAVLDALHQLSVHERRALLLGELGGVPHDVAARELSTPQASFEHQLALGTRHLADLLGCDPDEVRSRLLSLAGAASAAALPRPAAVRREGRRRRRTHTALAVAAATFVAVGSGAVAHESPRTPEAGPAADTGSAGVTEAPADGSTSTALGEPTPTEDAGPTLPSADALLTARDIAVLTPGTRWREGTTHDNTSGSGINTVCQRDRFADPEGLAALVRGFRTLRGAPRSTVQVMEISEDADEAQRTFATVSAWFAGCQASEVHLRTTHTVSGVGDRALLARLDGWRGPQPAYAVAVAQVGQVVTTLVVRTAGTPPPSPSRTARTLAGAVRKICASTDQDDCVERPEVRPAAVQPSGEERGILSTIDLPGLAGIDRPWVSTAPSNGRVNPAATTCDRARFAQSGAVRTRTRTFLLPPAVRVPSRFGLTETYGTFRTGKAARAFMGTIRERFAGCEDRDLATQVTTLRSLTNGPLDGSTWRLETELSESRQVVFDVGFVRRGASVAQVTFIPAGRADLPEDAFRQIVLRAGERLREIG